MPVLKIGTLLFALSLNGQVNGKGSQSSVQLAGLRRTLNDLVRVIKRGDARGLLGYVSSNGLVCDDTLYSREVRVPKIV
jgi:hypothetical protein